ncbi:MAG TPA: hypothetical protein VG944_20345 [Fimbriimonas sp.]|nr:hypothetical protein [Fimbriimonas sp.]
MSYTITLTTDSGDLPVADSTPKGPVVDAHVSKYMWLFIGVVHDGSGPHPSQVDLRITPNIWSQAECIEGSPSSSACNAGGSISHGGTNVGSYSVSGHTSQGGNITDPFVITVPLDNGVGSASIHAGAWAAVTYSPVSDQGADAAYYMNFTVVEA